MTWCLLIVIIMTPIAIKGGMVKLLYTSFHLKLRLTLIILSFWYSVPMLSTILTELDASIPVLNAVFRLIVILASVYLMSFYIVRHEVKSKEYLVSTLFSFGYLVYTIIMLYTNIGTSLYNEGCREAWEAYLSWEYTLFVLVFLEYIIATSYLRRNDDDNVG